jgi:hypothetical protein
MDELIPIFSYIVFSAVSGLELYMSKDQHQCKLISYNSFISNHICSIILNSVVCYMRIYSPSSPNYIEGCGLLSSSTVQAIWTAKTISM